MNSVELCPVKHDLGGELAKKIYYECAFCGKKEALYADSRHLYEKLSGDEFYCCFCLRHGFNTKNNKNVLILSFRSILGYYYNAFYLHPVTPDKRMYLCEIQDYADSHAEVGLKNPVFYYDPTTYLWFIDFSRIGKDKKKVKLEEVFKTISNMLACFNLRHYFYNIKISSFYFKLEESIEKFYHSRYRPDNRPQCVPTLAGCLDYITVHKSFTLEETRYFTPEHFDILEII
jgi:hypothetical protein